MYELGPEPHLPYDPEPKIRTSFPALDFLPRLAGWFRLKVMRSCVRGTRIHCRSASRYLLRRSRLCIGMTGFVDQVWAPELRGRGMLWVVLWGVALRREGVRESRKLIARRGESSK